MKRDAELLAEFDLILQFRCELDTSKVSKRERESRERVERE